MGREAERNHRYTACDVEIGIIFQVVFDTVPNAHFIAEHFYSAVPLISLFSVFSFCFSSLLLFPFALLLFFLLLLYNIEFSIKCQYHKKHDPKYFPPVI